MIFDVCMFQYDDKNYSSPSATSTPGKFSSTAFTICQTTSVAYWLVGSHRVRYIVGSSRGRVKPKTMKLVFVASLRSMQH
jgi:hypothetical protein